MSIQSKTRRHSNYPSMERNLEIDFGKYLPRTKKELRERMFVLKYRFKPSTGERLPITDKQLNHSWSYLKKQYGSQMRLDTTYQTELYDDKVRYRATKNRYIRGKLYKKGQFLPQRKKWLLN